MKIDNTIPGHKRAQIDYVNRRLVKTLSKDAVLNRLKHLRRYSVDPVEADLLGELISEVDSGDLDG